MAPARLLTAVAPALVLIATGAAAQPGGRAGTLSGEVRLVASPVASSGFTLSDAVVYLEDAPGRAELQAAPPKMVQLGKDFVPGVLIVPKGSTVEFPNDDAFIHNVFSVSPGNTFDLGMHRFGEVATARLERPGVVSVYCNIHPQMVGYILVVANPHFARVAADGTFRLPAVPPGEWRVTAWFPRGAPVTKTVRIDPGGEANVSFILRERSDAGRHKRKDGSAYLDYAASAEAR